jgi:hypothetical protein
MLAVGVSLLGGNGGIAAAAEPPTVGDAVGPPGRPVPIDPWQLRPGGPGKPGGPPGDRGQLRPRGPGKPAGPRAASCPDIGVKGIRFDIRRSAPFRGEVRITAVVVNGSDVPFESRAGQQSLQLYEVPMEGSARLVVEQRFAILQPGRTVSVAYTRNWNASSPAEGEFPPTY